MVDPLTRRELDVLDDLAGQGFVDYVVNPVAFSGTSVRDWKAAEAGLEDLVDRQGITLTPLRPAGLVEIDDRRIDVVADSELIAAGVRVRVCEVEGNRVVVEAVDHDSVGSEATEE